MNERLTQALMRVIVVMVTAAIPALAAWLVTPEARDLLGAWYIYVPILTGVLSGIAKAIGGPTSQPIGPAEEGIRAGRARGSSKRPNVLAA